ncbi:MAG: ABC transporter permease [Tepidiformaceae bacterium]
MTSPQVIQQPALSQPSRSFEGARNYHQEVQALATRWWIELRRDRLNLAFNLIQPAVWMVFFGTGVGRTVNRSVIGTDDYIAFMLPGIIAFTIVGNGVSSAMPLMWDKETGYLDKLMSMPIARSTVIVSRFVFQLCLNSAQVVIMLAVALALDVRIAAGPVAVLLILGICGLLTLAFTAIFAAMAYRVANHGTFFAVTGFITLPLLFMSNAFVPLNAMPQWMEVIARFNPLTYAITSMRTLVLDGWASSLLAPVAVLAVVAAAFLAIGTFEFRRLTGERVR